MSVATQRGLKVKIMTAIRSLKGPLVRGTTGSICVVLIAASFSYARHLQQRPAVPTDYMVATVNGRLITYSDVVWQLALQPNTSIDPPSVADLKRALGLLIDQQLILQEAQKLPQIHGEDKEVEAALGQLVRHFPSQDEMRRRMTGVGLTADKLREIVHDRVDIDKYLDFRFRAFTVVTPKEIENHYRDVYVPRFRARSPGGIVPLLEQVRAEIEQTLTEAKIESSINDYLEEARQRAEIVILREFK